MNFRSNLLLASLLCLPLAACGDDGEGTSTDASTGNATPATTTNQTTTTDPGTTQAETTAPTTEADTTTSPTTTDPATTDPATTDPATTDPTTTDGTTDPGTTDPGTTTGDDTTGAVGLGWAADVYPVLNPPVSCDCHTPGSGGLKMGDVDTAYTNLVDVPSTEAPIDRIEPGDPATSYLWHKINGTHVEAGGSGSKMPLGAPELPQPTRDLIEQWITAGALP